MTSSDYVALIVRDRKRHLKRQRLGPDATFKAIRNGIFFAVAVTVVILYGVAR